VRPEFGINNTITITQLGNGEGVTKNTICSYLLAFPQNASYNDTLTFRVNVASRAEVYYFIGDNFNDSKGLNVSGGQAKLATKYVA
jgi:hypothetical protein